MVNQRKHPPDKHNSNATEQQLQAANQQLRASEQQLKASNQQLLAEVTERKKVEKELRDTRNYLERLINYANAPIIVWDTKLGVTRFNHAFENLTGYAADEVIGQELSILFPKASRDESMRNIESTLRGQYWESVEIPVLRKDGDIRIALWNSANIYAEDGKTLLATIAQGQDITERKKVEAALQASNYQLQISEKQLREANQELEASEQQIRAANQQLDASNQQLRASQEELRKVNHDQQERVKELECLYGLSQLVERRDITLEEILQGLAELIPSSWQYPEITAARIIFGDGRFQTNNFSETEWVQSADIKVYEQKAGTIEVCYLKERPVIDEGPFQREERNLLNVLAERLGRIVERKRAEEALRAANQQLQANGQQLKAANQQLQANGQQLKAANQQLQASEQQMKAANEQLRASEQQLRAANQQLQAEVAERKRAEEKIQASLKEKDVLIKEIHHRVKNNMQVISSILNLQSKHIEDEQALKIFRNGQGRIRSMALVHEKMYEAEDLANIDFAEYIRSTTSYLFSLHGISEAVHPNIDVEDIFLDINTAIPCGLIINELVSNSLKYAFPDGREGEIRIGLSLDKDDKFTLTVKDNGIGFPKDMDFRNTESLGMQLVIMLTEQIEGTVELERKEGTAFTITFEKPKH